MPGDRLLFTKSLGTGVISTAIKKGVAKQEWIDAAVASMTTLNKKAAEVIARRPTPSSKVADRAFAIHSMTDVTGFGLIGHAREMALASNVSLRFFSSRIPLLAGALECVRAGHIPGGLNANRDFAECIVSFDDAVPDDIRTILFDPQTAGGLLIAVASADAARLQQALNQAGIPAVRNRRGAGA